MEDKDRILKAIEEALSAVHKAKEEKEELRMGLVENNELISVRVQLANAEVTLPVLVDQFVDGDRPDKDALPLGTF